jgi:peptide-methionine (S)-S-oxide reductase
MSVHTITLGGGCFWCTEAVFDRVRGVLDVESGYCNGLQARQPSYEDVCRGDTGYNEVVRVQYDASIIRLADVLTIFCSIHDPTSLNRQGHDLGTQYRSGVYFSEPSDEAVIVQRLTELQAHYKQPIVTEVEALQHYWPAEDYHQDYFLKHPQQGYCAFVVAPKVSKLEQHFSDWLKA